jgi:hypothetical protein
MIGGIVIETIDCGDRIWVNCEEENTTTHCALCVERNAKSRCISPGDSLWWQSGNAYWTPHSYVQGSGNGGHHYDIKIPRIGFSGVGRPEKVAA